MSTSKEIVINYVPGEECRVAVIENERLEEFHAERMDSVSHVGNIYVGRVVNVEAGIQAAFVDFGLPQNGFLHVSDVHPQYFPGEDEETTERVGKKTPRRERPPIQACFRRGQEVAVQVLKEGVGTKGPTVTSYLSIPGRFLVMMPQMDRVGVSRKVEDEETRRKMREILDQLDLPEGFGFILRTAGMERTKMELKRDLAYLQRLWKDMEKRWKTGNKPRLLYSESDLLVRALRDMLTTDIDRIVIDNESAMNRAARFLKIVAPRSATKLVRYTGAAPIFHVMGIEKEIQMIHAREVPMPSGGRLVIDEAEALVAIDVNSGKMRDAKDAETTAFRTNMEAADEICRQLKLRDLGGVVINDFIDMRQMKHRRELENRMRENLKRDRARWTIAPISEFGILEMTRQRMRGSHESVHFADCPVCRGRGLVQRPDSVAADALRELGAILENERVKRAELVVSPRIAGELLSTRRRALSRLEKLSGKHVDVRVSDAIPVDRVSFYAYDENGADMDAARISHRKVRPEELQQYVLEAGAEFDDSVVEDKPVEDPDEVVEEVVEPLHPIEIEHGDEPANSGAAQLAPGAEGEEQGGRRRRRRGGRGRGRGRDQGPPPGHAPRAGAPMVEPRTAPSGHQTETASAKPVDGGDLTGASDRTDGPGRNQPPHDHHEGEGEGEGGRRRRRRRRGGRGRGRGDGEFAHAGDPVDGASGAPTPPRPHGPPASSPIADTGGRVPPNGHPQGQKVVVRPNSLADLFRRESDTDDVVGGADAGPVEPVASNDGPARAMAGEGDQRGDQSHEDLAGEGPGGRKRRRRRRGRSGGGGGGMNADPARASAAGAPTASSNPRPTASGAPASEHRGNAGTAGAGLNGQDGPGGGEGGKRRRKRGGRGRGRGGAGGGGGEAGGPSGPGGEGPRPSASNSQPRNSQPQVGGSNGQPSGAAKPQPRSLYGAARRKLLPSEKRSLGGEE